MTEQACIIGIFRSGSNYLRALLETNFDCRIGYNTFGWKHGLFPIIAGGSVVKMPQVPAITITKNPFSSIASLHGYFRTNGRNLHCGGGPEMSSFLRGSFVIRDDGNPKSAELYFPSVADYWVAMTWNVMSIVGRRPSSLHVRYEDLVGAPEAETTRLADTLGLARISETFFVPEGKMRNLPGRAVDWSADNTMLNQQFARGDVVNHAYMAGFSAEDRAFILSRLPEELLDRTGYTNLVHDLVKTG